MCEGFSSSVYPPDLAEGAVNKDIISGFETYGAEVIGKGGFCA